MRKGVWSKVASASVTVAVLMAGLVLVAPAATAVPSLASPESASAGVFSALSASRALTIGLPSSPMELAALVDEPVEDRDLRDARSTTVANPDGTMTTEVSSVPVNYQSAAGEWVPIDSDLTETLRVGYAAER